MAGDLPGPPSAGPDPTGMELSSRRLGGTISEGNRSGQPVIAHEVRWRLVDHGVSCQSRRFAACTDRGVQFGDEVKGGGGVVEQGARVALFLRG